MSKREAIRASARLRDSIRHAAGLHPFDRATIRHIPIRIGDLTDHKAGTWMGVVRDVSRFCGVPVEQITGSDGDASRKARHVRARALVALILRNRGFSYPRIGQWLGGRHHATLINAVRRIEGRLRDDEARLVEALSGAVGHLA